jgi:hypothetical protein
MDFALSRMSAQDLFLAINDRWRALGNWHRDNQRSGWPLRDIWKSYFEGSEAKFIFAAIDSTTNECNSVGS